MRTDDHTMTPSPRTTPAPAVGLTTLAAVFHVAVLVSRIPALAPARHAQVSLLWPEATETTSETRPEADQEPSRPVSEFAAGQLLLVLGMAVVTLAAWLHIMHLSGALAR